MTSLFNIVANRGLNMSRFFTKNIARIEEIFKKTPDPFVFLETLEHYRKYLRRNLDFTIQLTGWKEFEWEEYYIYGPGDKEEYERLKLIKPSYKDVFKITSLAEHRHFYHGIFAQVTRISDSKRFKLPLDELKSIDKKSAEYQLLEDYCIWFQNY